ncbi:hypothetical protein PESP_b0445 [Pseudoalteromonas espejiana DSM 9414]|uniref:diguanylate cyclase n=1 Tax=Pseudoalteromonas espejiana TaxID=28107 RepID=A0A510XTI9_9GAMM|nr:GGDEF domain-containing protein [Pseudoalteromonas espejiana]ASM52004.1 hypothetical protein PESP_b0445 [Pseudoalteromonas espejiana DSM 9414]GEK54313.1 hypothetical protein PES01_11580 [Pseudoalteromonas espejiana]
MINKRNNTHIKILIERVWSPFVFALFLLLSPLAFAQSTEPNGSLKPLNYENTQTLINNIRANKLDYLLNANKLVHAFKNSEEQNWSELHLQAAALYAELLFRQEEFEALNIHLTKYLNNQQLIKQKDLHLLFLEAQLKYLSQSEKLTQAKELATRLENQIPQLLAKEKIITLRALAYYYTDTDALRKTLSAALTGLELSIKNNDIASQGYFYRKIADAYNYLNDNKKHNDKAIYYAKKAVTTFEKTNDGLFTAKAHWSLGNVFLEISDTKNALVYLNKALQYFKKVNMKKGLAFAQYSIANIQYQQANYTTALTLVKENIELARSANIHDMHLASLILLADIYIKQNRLDDANTVNNDVYSNMDKFSRSIYKAQFLAKRYELKRKLNLTEDAFEAIENKLIYTIKHYEATSESNIKTLQIKFEVKEKEDKILQLEYEKDINKLRATEEHQQKIIWRLSASIAFIIVIVTLFLFYRQALQRKKYRSIAFTDFLTNSLNRRGIMKQAKLILNRQKATIAIIDLDYFKQINDKFGHDIGDLVLIKFAQAAKDALTNADLFGRYGGEEWLFVLNTTDENIIKKLFEKLNFKLAEYCNDIQALPKNEVVTFSAGVAISNNKNNSLDELIKLADLKLYKAKQNGRNQIVID